MPDAEVILRNLLDKVINEPYKNGTVTLKPLTSGGANYTSILYSINITTQHEDDVKLFAKVANVSGKLREAMNAKQLFETEQFYYRELVNTYEKIQDKYNIPLEYRFISPKFYGSNDRQEEETVVLEDLVSNGYSPYSRFKSIDWQHAAIAVKSLARFLALSFSFEKEDPDNFAKVFNKLAYKLPESQDNEKDAVTWRKMVEGSVQVTKEEHKPALSKLLFDEIAPEDMVKFKRPLYKPVLCHGHYRISNLLFQRRNGKLETMVVDYQTLHTGCAPIDLLYLEFMGTDEEFRRENHQRYVDYYFEQLTLALERLGLDVNDVYPREMFEIELREMLPVSLRTAAFILPMVLVEADQAPQLGKCEDVENLALSPNELFAERFSGLVSDCVRWGVI